MKNVLVIAVFFSFVSVSYGFVSVNVPLDHWSYAALDKLVSIGFIDSSLLGTKPFSRVEMARLIEEALEKRQESEETKRVVLSLLKRLKREFKEELIILGTLDGFSARSFIKPVEDIYFKCIYGDEEPDLENQRGDIFAEGSNYRFGFSSRMKFWNHIAFSFHPELKYQKEEEDWEKKGELIEGYGKLDVFNLEIEVGRDSLWWGPGYYGSMLMSNNAEPFDLVKISNSRPILLPWFFRYMGPFKATWFLTELEDEREIHEPNLTGFRLNFKPHPSLELGLSRTI
ncbi:MAG: capsule assembly Wzi family protein, partial [Thermodesulfobacteriota bacterium]|nr:capsule assembly Wzi family protein [Thermodesulfobacteriota bacterium]